MPTHAELARKSYDVTPTLDTSGNVIKWEVECTYKHRGYSSTQRAEFKTDVPRKAPDQWTLNEILAECPTVQWEAVFNSQFDSAGPDARLNAPTRKPEFDVSQLKPNAPVA